MGKRQGRRSRHHRHVGHASFIRDVDRARALMAVLSSPLSLLLAVPPVTRAFSAATVISSAIYAWLWWSGMAPEVAPYIVMVPASALFHPWTVVTSAFVETSLMEVRFYYLFFATPSSP